MPTDRETAADSAAKTAFLIKPPGIEEKHCQDEEKVAKVISPLPLIFTPQSYVY